MKYFIDVQHYSYEKSVCSIFRKSSVMVTEVISVGIVNENGEGLYLINKDFDLGEAWENAYVRENILKPMYTAEYIHGSWSKGDIAILLKGRGVSLDYIASRVVSFINKSLGPNEFYVNSIYAWQAFGSLIEYDGYESYWNYSNWRPLDDKSNDPRFPKRSFDSRKTAMTEAMFCKDKYDFLEKVKLEEEKKKEGMEKCRKERERIDEQLAGLWRKVMNPEGVCLNDVLNPQSDTELLKIELGIKDVLKFYFNGIIDYAFAIDLLCSSLSIKRDAKLAATFEGFKIHRNVDYSARVLMQLTEEFLKRKAEEKERLEFIVKCKAGVGCYIGGVDPCKDDYKYTPCEIEKMPVDFLDGMNVYQVRCPELEHEKPMCPPASKVDYRPSVFSFGYVKPKLATREECDAPSRPKKDPEVTSPRKEHELADEINKKNDGRYYIDYRSYCGDSVEIILLNRDNGSCVLQVCGKKVKAMTEVLDFLNGKCISLFCYQFEAVPNVNFRKRCVECGCEFDIKIKE